MFTLRVEDPEKQEAPPETFPTIVPTYMRKVSGAALQLFRLYRSPLVTMLSACGAAWLVSHNCVQHHTSHLLVFVVLPVAVLAGLKQIVKYNACIVRRMQQTLKPPNYDSRLWLARHAAGCARLQALHEVLRALRLAPSCDRPA